MNLRIICLLCAITMDWFAPCPGRGQVQEETIERPAAPAESQLETAVSGPSRGRSLGDVVDNNVVVKKGETARDVVVMGGSATIDGTVAGDLVVLMGSARLGPDAEVRGDLVVVGGTLDADPAARIRGDRVVIPSVDEFLKHVSWVKWPAQWFHSGLAFARPLPHEYFWSWMIAGIALLLYIVIAVLFPRQVQASVTVLEEKPGNALLAGLLAFALAGPLLLLLVITVIGLVVVPFLLCGLVAAFLFGKVAVYRYAGQQVGSQLGWAVLQKPLAALLAGALLFYLLYIVPVLGFLVWGAVATLGMGAVLLALFKRSPSPAAAADGVAATPAAASAPPRLEVPESAALLPRAGFWLRTLATLLDLMLVGTIMMVVFHLPDWFLLAWVGYHLVLWTWKGTTIGGIVFGLKILRTDGQPMNFAVALVRLLGAFFSAAALGLGFFWAGWSRDRQSWHDKIAGAIVVKSPGPTPLV
jgi:uncharacterized RDD family membrane protein YckC